MLTQVEIRNFRCLREVSVPLKPLTVLVGPNDSGKSVFLAGLRTLSGTRNLELTFDHWKRDRNLEIKLGVMEANSWLEFSSRLPNTFHAAESMQPLSSFVLPSTGIEMISAGYSDQGSAPVVDNSGKNIPALVDFFLRRDRRRLNKFIESARSLITGLEEIEISTPDPAKRGIDLVVDGGMRLPADQASVGVRLVLFFLGLAYHPSPPKTILIEEPENGVHPKRLGDVMRLLREITEGKHGDHAAQVILTTHSPYLLDHVKLETDQVLVFRRNDDGSRTAEPADAERLKTFLDEFMLGEVWYNEGEEGLVGKKP